MHLSILVTFIITFFPLYLLAISDDRLAFFFNQQKANEYGASEKSISDEKYRKKSITKFRIRHRRVRDMTDCM